VNSRYRAPEGLAERHDTSAFTCRSTEQTHWLRRHARQSARSGTTKIFVVTDDDGGPVVAYYAWRMAHLAPAAAPARLSNGAGRYLDWAALKSATVSITVLRAAVEGPRARGGPIPHSPGGDDA